MTDVRLIRCSSHEEWLRERQKSIGSSDAAAVLGVSPFATPLSVYVAKTEPPEKEEESEVFRWGHALEEPIAQEFKRRTKFLVAAPDALGVWRRTGEDHLHATPDRLVVTPASKLGTDAVLEIKTSRHRGSEWDDGIPLHVQVQVQLQLHVLALDVAYVAVLIQGQEYRQFETTADRSFCSAMLEKLSAFWKRVQNREPPMPSGEADYDTVRKMFRRGTQKTISLPAEIAPTVDLWIASKEARLASEKHEKACAAAIMAAIGDNEIGVLPDGRRVKWTTEERHEAAREARTTTVRKLIPLKQERGNGIGSGGTQTLLTGDAGGEVRDRPGEVSLDG